MGKYSQPLQKTRQRKHHPKVTSGCVTCKSRRVKCDEGKPTCKQCNLTARSCGGYNVQKTWLFELPNPANQTNPATLPTAITNTNDQVLERRALAFFMEKTLPQIHFLEKSAHQFWSYDIPLFGATWPPVRHLMIALASRHELASGTSYSQTIVRVYAEHYSTALTELLELPPVGTEDVFLVCCFLMIALEAFGEPLSLSDACFRHVLYGVRILDETNFHAWKFNDHRRVIDFVIKPMFARIGSTLAFFLTPDSNDKILSVHKYSRPVIPSMFQDISVAKKAFFKICRWRHQYGIFCNKLSWNTASAEFLDVQKLLEQWWKAFKRFSSRVPEYQTEEKYRVTCLESSFRFLMRSFRASTERDLVINSFRIEDLTVDLCDEDKIIIRYATESSIVQDVVTQGTMCPLINSGPGWLWPVTTVTKQAEGRCLVQSVLSC